MKNFIIKIFNIFLFVNKKILEKKYNVNLDDKTSYQIGSTKKIFLKDETFEIKAETKAHCNQANAKIKQIVEKNLKTPEKLLDYIEQNGTPIYKINHADKILNIINEEEGFITELKGFKALFLNFIISLMYNKKLSIKFYTQPMFVLRDLAVDPYYMAHQFYKWYGYKQQLPGYDYKTQQNFKKTFNSLRQQDISRLSLKDIVAVQEAINRDNEAINFVLNLCKENFDSKYVLNKILNKKFAKI